MHLRDLGNSGLEISPVILGTWAIGGWMWGGSDEKKAIEAIHMSMDLGVNTIDTAPIYGMGHSEEIVAKAIKGKRDQVVIATKVGMRWDSDEGADPWQQTDLQGNPITIRQNLKAKSIIAECEQSLKRLKTDVIDLYQCHRPDETTPIEESWGAMVKLKEQGKVRAIGVCNYNLEQLKEAHAIHPVDSLQPPYSLVRRGIEKEIVPFCINNSIGIIVYSPLERGLLTGKYHPGAHFAKGDHRSQKPTFSSEYLKPILSALEKVHIISKNIKASVTQAIINCTIHRNGITAAIVGARDAQQARENALGATLPFTPHERETIEELLADKKFQRPLYD